MKTKKIVIFLITIIVLMPTIASIFGFGEILAINENRNKVIMPTYEQVVSEGFQSINNYYNDNFGLRDLYIRAQHQIDYSVFGYSKELFFDKRKSPYLFYRNVIANEQIANETMSEDTQNEIISQLITIKNILESKNINFKFIIAPQKNEILQAESKDIPVNRPTKNMYYIMQDKFLSSSLNSNYVNIIDELKIRNNDIPVYYYSDFHWNDWGAACAFGKVINQYANEIGKPNVYSPDMLEVSTFSPEPNYAQLSSLSVLNYNAPNEYTVNYAREIQMQESNIDYPKLTVLDNLEKAEFNNAILFIGDSYTPPAISSFNGTNAGIITLFPRVYFCHWDNAENILNNIPEDVGIVVIEAIESSYSYFDKKISTLY